MVIPNRLSVPTDDRNKMKEKGKIELRINFSTPTTVQNMQELLIKKLKSFFLKPNKFEENTTSGDFAHAFVDFICSYVQTA